MSIGRCDSRLPICLPTGSPFAPPIGAVPPPLVAGVGDSIGATGGNVDILAGVTNAADSVAGNASIEGGDAFGQSSIGGVVTLHAGTAGRGTGGSINIATGKSIDASSGSTIIRTEDSGTSGVSGADHEWQHAPTL